jgi:protein TonB
MFETVTAASPWDVPTAKRTQLLGGAFALHFLVVTTYLVLSVWTIREVSPPRLIEAFVPQPVPPTVVTFEPARPSRPRTAPPAGGPTPTTPAPVLTQPTTIPDLVPAAPTTFESPSSGAIGNWVDDGVPATGGESPAGGAGEATVTFHSGMTRPQILHRTEPRYPEVARRLHKQGVVVVEAEIGRDGLVRSARAVSGLGFGFEESALAALQTWRFTPATLNGQPVAVYYRLSVAFKLQ